MRNLSRQRGKQDDEEHWQGFGGTGFQPVLARGLASRLHSVVAFLTEYAKNLPDAPGVAGIFLSEVLTLSQNFPIFPTRLFSFA
jgi:hypothetical protein